MKNKTKTILLAVVLSAATTISPHSYGNEMMASGKIIYEKHCSRCHGKNAGGIYKKGNCRECHKSTGTIVEEEREAHEYGPGLDSRSYFTHGPMGGIGGVFKQIDPYKYGLDGHEFFKFWEETMNDNQIEAIIRYIDTYFWGANYDSDAYRYTNPMLPPPAKKE